MSAVDHVVRQWLETDAAFGVTEVPLSTRKAAHTPMAATGLPAPRPAAAAVRPAATAPARPAASMPSPVSVPVRASAEPARRPLPPPREAINSQDIRPGGGARKKVTIVMPPIPAGNVPDLPPITRKQKETALDALRREIEESSSALLTDMCTRVVFGEGDPDAALLFVGEGPGAEEDRTGRPFVGRSGQLLDKMIAAMGYKREQVYIANVVKLRCAEWDPQGAGGAGRWQDRPPNPEEVAQGLPQLHRQIEIIRPKVIVTLGAPAVKHLTAVTEGVMKIRGKWLNYRGIPVMPTYHPSFVLRAYTPENRGKVWSDLKEAMNRIKGS